MPIKKPPQWAVVCLRVSLFVKKSWSLPGPVSQTWTLVSSVYSSKVISRRCLPRPRWTSKLYLFVLSIRESSLLVYGLPSSLSGEQKNTVIQVFSHLGSRLTARSTSRSLAGMSAHKTLCELCPSSVYPPNILHRYRMLSPYSSAKSILAATNSPHSLSRPVIFFNINPNPQSQCNRFLPSQPGVVAYKPAGPGSAKTSLLYLLWYIYEQRSPVTSSHQNSLLTSGF